MNMDKVSPRPTLPPADKEEGQPVHRSGAVARMLRMPVATLRVWERRYGLTQPALTPSGQRLYSADDVRQLIAEELDCEVLGISAVTGAGLNDLMRRIATALEAHSAAAQP